MLAYLPVYSQEKPVYNDTSYFMPFDIDFNLLNSASRDHIENVRSLIMRGANVNAATPEGVTSLMYAADIGDLEMVKLLMANSANPNIQPASGITALMSAVIQNHFEIAEYLVTHGANPNLRDGDGITALNYAAAYNFFEMADMLLFYKAKPGIADNRGNTPLISAAYNNCPEAVDILVRNGADINTPDNNGFTPLMIAIQRGNKTITGYLIDNGADIKKVNKAGMTALAFAVEASDYKLTGQLINMGADVNHKISGSRNILELARENRDEEIIELLASEGAQQNNYPNFNQFFAGAGMSFNGDDFTTSANFGLYDTKYKFAVQSGFAFRPVAVMVLRDETSSLAYQYWERRYYFYLGLSKNFSLINLKNNFTCGPLLRLDEIYTFGGYRGSNASPDASFKTIPAAGWFFASDWMDISLKYQYMDFNTEYINPGRFSLDLNFLIPLRKKRIFKKNIRWLTSN